MVHRSCLDQIQFQPDGFKLLLEILVRGRIQSLEEVPYAFGSRYRGASKSQLQGRLGLCAAAGAALRGEILQLVANLNFAHLERRQNHPQQQKRAHTRKENQRHANAGLTVNFGHKVGGGNVEGYASRDGQSIG